MSEVISGTELIERNPHYRVFSANCQTFAISFLEELCKWGFSVQNKKNLLEKQTLESLKKRLLREPFSKEK